MRLYDHFSVTSLLFEITYSHLSCEKMTNTVTPLSKVHTFSYKSKCGNLKSAMIEFYRVHNSLLHDDELVITHAESLRIPSDDKDFELSILFEFELNNPEKIGEIVERFNLLTVYLDSISL
jgi:hypothetical protein